MLDRDAASNLNISSTDITNLEILPPHNIN